MKARKCPYCGRRIPYFTVFNEKKYGQHICNRCGKESKLLITKNIYVYFLIAIVVAAVIATMWIALGFINNPLGVVLVAIPLVIFYFSTPRFVKVLPLKKYKKSMEAAKAAREYSGEMQFKQNYGNNITAEDTSVSPLIEESNDFSINSQVFSSIKANRKKPETEEDSPVDSQQGKTQVVNRTKEEKYIPIIENNREAHASSSENVPLQRIHKERPLYQEVQPESENIKVYKKEEPAQKRKKYEGSKYSSNRRF